MDVTNKRRQLNRIIQRLLSHPDKISYIIGRIDRSAASPAGFQQPQQQGAGGQQTGAAGGQERRAPTARLAMAGSPDARGGAVVSRQGASGITPGDEFMAGFNSND